MRVIAIARDTAHILKQVTIVFFRLEQQADDDNKDIRLTFIVSQISGSTVVHRCIRRQVKDDTILSLSTKAGTESVILLYMLQAGWAKKA
jgi:hypothetical protein